MLGIHRRRQRARRLQVREVDYRPVDWREDDVERPVAASHPPPVAVEDRVAEVERALTVGLDKPRDLGIAETIDGGQGGEQEWTYLHLLPYLDRPSPQVRALELRVGLRQGEVLDIRPAGPGGLVHRGVDAQGRCEGSGVGVVAMQVADQPGDRGTPGSGRHYRWQFGPASLLPERGEGRAGVSQRIDYDGDLVSLDLESRPSQPPDFHRLLLYRTVVRYHRCVPRRSQAAVAATRAAVTAAAVERASVQGLEALTIGGLAEEVAMRKSSVFSLYGSKEELQLATLEAAIRQFTDEVWAPVADVRPGMARLVALCDSWLSYHEREVMPGGCFLTAATIEFDARPGPLRDAVASATNRWLGVLEREIAVAIDAGELPADAQPADVAFQLNALAAAASYGFQLSRDRDVFTRARRSMRRALGA
jgi:AcrR family transcriptional regulator